MDLQKYGKLLNKILPTIITTEKEYERLMAEFERLFNNADNLTNEEDAVLDLLVLLIEKYEEEHFQLNASTPLGILKELMDQHDLKPKDLWELFGSKGITSEVLNGDRSISKKMAKKLG